MGDRMAAGPTAKTTPTSTLNTMQTAPPACKSLFEVRNNVFRSFRPYGKPDEVRPYARLHELLIRQLAVRMAGGMENAGTRVHG